MKGVLNKEHIIPQMIGGIQTDIIERGIVTSYRNEIRPAFGGVEIGNLKNLAGTLGYAVTDRKTRKNLYLLGCAHVLSNDLESARGEPILQPSLGRGGSLDKSILGYTTKIIPLIIGLVKEKKLTNLVDAGIAFVGLNNKDERNEKLIPILDSGTVITSETSDIKIGQKVFKEGKTSGLTHGEILLVNQIEVVRMETDKYEIFRDQIVVNIESGKGDSGAIGIVSGTTSAFGMLIGGDNKIATFNKITNVLKLLDIEFIKN